MKNFTENYKKYKYLEICEGWIHGIKIQKTFPPDIPLLSKVNLILQIVIFVNLIKLEKIYDFIYICLKVDEKKDTCDDWATYNKN